MNAAFEGVTVADVMTPASDVHTVAATASVADLMDSMLEHRHTGYPVFRDATAVGMVTLDDARSVRAVERDAMRVADVMSDDVYTIPAPPTPPTPSTPSRNTASGACSSSTPTARWWGSSPAATSWTPSASSNPPGRRSPGSPRSPQPP